MRYSLTCVYICRHNLLFFSISVTLRNQSQYMSRLSTRYIHTWLFRTQFYHFKIKCTVPLGFSARVFGNQYPSWGQLLTKHISLRGKDVRFHNFIEIIRRVRTSQGDQEHCSIKWLPGSVILSAGIVFAVTTETGDPEPEPMKTLELRYSFIQFLMSVIIPYINVEYWTIRIE